MSNNRRQFLKNSIGTAAAASFAALPAIANMPVSTDVKKQKNKHWIWINPDKKDEVAVLKKDIKHIMMRVSEDFYLKQIAKNIIPKQKMQD